MQVATCDFMIRHPNDHMTGHAWLEKMKVLRNTNRSILKPIKSESLSVKKVCSFGYGQFCVRDNGQAGFLLTFPFIEEKWLVREECKPTFSYAAGPFMTMTNLLWGSTEVTVKGLSDVAQNKRFADLLIAEEENMSYLQHPLILQLLALSTSASLERKQLVFERVTFGSFYSILHERRSEYPILHLGTIVHILLQMIEALVFLHWRGFIHRSFSSHAIQIVAAGRAKISNFEYMIESKDAKKCDGIIHFPIPKQLYCWSSPEVVAGKTGSIKSDLYSFCAVMQECLTDALPWNGLDGEAVKDSMASGHYLVVDPTLSEPYYSIVRTGIQANPKERTTPLQDIGYLLKNDFKHFLDKVPCTQRALMIVEADMEMQRTEQEVPPDNFEEITDLFYKGTNISSYGSSKAVSSMESQSETLCDMVVQSDEMNAHLQNRVGGLYQENVGSPSTSLSLMSDYETVTSSDSEEEDIENWQTELQVLDDRFSAIQIHHRSTLENLLNIQTFLQEHNTILDAEEKRKLSENVYLKENTLPYSGTDETDHPRPPYNSKSYAGWSAKGPPLHYIPPDGAASSRIDISSDTRRIQSGTVVDTVRKALKKGEWCAGLGSFKGKTLGQDLLQLTKRSSKNSQADDIMRHQYYPSSTSAPQWPAKNLRRKMAISSKVRADSEPLQNKKQCEPICDHEEEQRSNKTREDGEETKLEKLFRHFAGRHYQSEENEDSSEIPGGMKPLQDYSKDTDSNLSTETSYFTPENDVSVEKTEHETLNVSDESEHTFGGWSPSMCFDKTLLTWTGKNPLEKNTPELTTTGLSTTTRSTIDVEELSSISGDQKSSLLQCITPRNTEASARHSTPVSPGNLMLGAVSKRRSFLEKQLKSPNSTLVSPNKNVSSKTLDSFMSALCDMPGYVSPYQERTFTMKEQNTNVTPIKNHESGSDGDDALPGPQCSLNKTDHECQSMEITCLINETICGHSESGHF